MREDDDDGAAGNRASMPGDISPKMVNTRDFVADEVVGVQRAVYVYCEALFFDRQRS